MESRSNEEVGDRNVFFHEEKNSPRYVPRTVLLDSEDNPMKDIMKSKGNILSKNQLIHGKESSNYYTRASYTIGRDVIEPALEAIRHQLEKCDNIGTIIFQNCFTGATGSGMISNVRHRLSL